MRPPVGPWSAPSSTWTSSRASRSSARRSMSCSSVPAPTAGSATFVSPPWGVADVAAPFRTFTSAVIPLLAENVDTDQIVPARYLKVTTKEGLREALFRDWRYDEDGGLKEPLFVMDRVAMLDRKILLVGDNFGTGSSREHAPWALRAWGIRAILATSFADI